MKPARTPFAVLDRLASRIEEIGEERHRAYVDSVVPPRAACQRHGWSPSGPGSNNWDALASLCPGCYEERRERDREQETPETRTIEVNPFAGSLYAQREWERHKQLRMAAGEVLPNTPAETEAIRWLDNARHDEQLDLKESASDRRRTHEAHWGRRMGVYRRQSYVPHPARAGR